MMVMLRNVDNDEFREVEAHVVKDGLAVTPFWPGRGFEELTGWVVTHVASGTKIGWRHKTPEEAEAALERLLPLADWTQGRDAFVKNWKLRDEVVAVLEGW
jgi:hypothetical protein